MKTTTEFSDELFSLMERVGLFFGQKGPKFSFPIIRYNKWLIRPGRVFHFARRYHPDLYLRERVRLFVRFRLIWLRCETEFRWDYAKIRDKEEKKISFFDLKNGYKRIYWLQRRAYECEIRAQRHFAAHGLSVVPFEGNNESDLSACQSLKGDLFIHGTKVDRIQNQLLEYVKKTSILTCVDEQYYRILDGTNELEEGSRELTGALKTLRSSRVVYCPVVLVHGDMRLENIVTDQKGVEYMIDFDRTFYASAYYDFVYGEIISDFCTLKSLVYCIREINKELGLPGSDEMKVAVAMFILDNLRYVLASGIKLRRDQYTMRVIARAFRYLQD